MKRGVVLLIFILSIFLISISSISVSAEEFKSCSLDSDCQVDDCSENSCVNQSYQFGVCIKPYLVAKECHCVDNICTVLVGSVAPVCDANHPGITYCKDEKTMMTCDSANWVSKACVYKCEGGQCIAGCYKNEDCGSSYIRKYCSNNEVCFDTTTPTCLDSGICGSNTVRKCSPCTSRCVDGRCVEEITPGQCGSTEKCQDGSVPGCKLIDNECKCSTCPAVSGCTDSDRGRNYGEKGYIKTKSGESAEDICESEGYLTEYYCVGDKIYSDRIMCPNGCKDGICLKEPVKIEECKDSDGTYIVTVTNGVFHPPSEDRYVKGSVTYGSITYEDYCINLIPYTDALGNKNIKYEKASEGIAVIEEGCIDGKKPYETSYFECPRGCKNGACVKEEISEEIKCIFKNSEKEQECYIAGSFTPTDEGVKFCRGNETCVINYKGNKGDKITWKSTCGEYKNTQQDGKQKTIEFECKTGETNISEIKNKGFKHAYFQCYDGEESKSTEREACKTAEFWKKFAENFCQSHCKKYKDTEKCGVNSFSLVDECYVEGADVPASTIPAEANETTQPTIEEPVLICKDSCPFENKCYPFGYRKGGKYCSDEGKFVEQLKGELICENNFECSSNVCVSGKCISEGLIQKILNWFKRLFG